MTYYSSPWYIIENHDVSFIVPIHHSSSRYVIDHHDSSWIARQEINMNGQAIVQYAPPKAWDPKDEHVHGQTDSVD